ncbi:GTP-binding protein [Haliangium sp.]|uniref:GTP-binding protein n=1 Tax=Haliangium sp. TaxID=2663208 RepID=UPI003D115A11
MASVDFRERQLTIKLVYYGPPLSGKTTNLRWIHAHVDRSHRGRLMTLDTRDDRTLFFDLLPIFFETAGLSFQIKIYTVPGQPMHEVTRRLVLRAVDGVAFVADSQVHMQPENRTSYDNLCRHLDILGLVDVPIVVQYNKRDLPDITAAADLPRLGRDPDEAVVEAAAIDGAGVFDTFYRLLGRTWDAVDAKMGLGRSFGIERAAFVDAVHRHLGTAAPPE